jgi:RNA polymerase sigma factor (sigma-70 family)
MQRQPLLTLVTSASAFVAKIPMTDKFDLVTLFSSSKNRLSRIVARIVPSADVEDILQETYLRASMAVVSEEIREPIAFVTQIAKNLALDHIKSAEFKKLHFVESEIIEGLINQDNSVDQTFNEVSSKQDLMEFLSAVKNLPPKCQEIYILKKLYGYSQKEISDRLEISTSTVEKHIAYGTKKLFHLMPPRGEKNSMSTRNEANPASVAEGVF